MRAAVAGGLVSYGVDTLANYPRAAQYVVSILRGAKPADLPVVAPAPTMAVNLKTARALGISVPAQVVARADVVIE